MRGRKKKRSEELTTHSFAVENVRLALQLSFTLTAQRIYQRLYVDWAHQAIGPVPGSAEKIYSSLSQQSTPVLYSISFDLFQLNDKTMCARIRTFFSAA